MSSLYDTLNLCEKFDLNGGYYTTNAFGYIQFDGPCSQFPRTDWKLHLTIDPQDVAKALDLLLPYFINNGIGPFKVADKQNIEIMHNPNGEQRGKMFTICDKNDINLNCINEIESILRSNGIRPSCEVIGDQNISGSRYISYRNDTDLMGNYISAAEVRAMNVHEFSNPFKKVNPFEGIILPMHAKQAENKTESANISSKQFLYNSGIAILFSMGCLLIGNSYTMQNRH